jgi:DNA polymerase-1
MILLIDGNNLAARANFIDPNLHRSDGIKTGLVFIAIKSIKFLIEKFNPTKTIVVFDRGWSKKRIEIYPEYKENRKDIYRTQKEIEEKNAYINQIKRFQEYISCLPINQVFIKSTEADDIIAYILNKFKDEVILVSSDSDFYQFIPYGVKIYDGIKQQFIDNQYVFNKLGIDSSDYLFYKSMLGDKTDNITSINGFGEKAAISVLQKSKCTQLQQLKENASSVSKKKEDKYQKFVDNFNIIERNYKLISLIENDLLEEEQKIEIEKLLNESVSFKQEKIFSLINEDEIKWDLDFFSFCNGSPKKEKDIFELF